MKIGIGMDSLLCVNGEKNIKNKRNDKSIKNDFCDSVKFSNGLKNVLGFGKIISQEMEESAEFSKLNRIKSEIEMNNFNVNCKKLADDMINL